MDFNNFTKDLTKEAFNGLIDPPLGRDKIIDTILSVISQEGKSNVLILGAAGSGKTAIAEGIAYRLAFNMVPPDFPKKKLYELNLTQLNSGAMYVGQFEERVTAFLDQITNDNSSVIFIDEIHMLMGFGSTSNSNASRDLSQIIKPHLARGLVTCIGATTKEEYERYIAHDAAFTRRFEIIELPELDNQSVLKVLLRYSNKIKNKKGIEFTEDTLRNVISVSNSLYPQRLHPDKSIDVLKRCILSYNNNSFSFFSKGYKDLSAYIKHLQLQQDLIDIENYESLLSKTRNWLGVSEIEPKKIQLSKEEIIKLTK